MENKETIIKPNLQPLFNYMPIFSIYFILLNLSNLSFPGTLNFIGELFSIISLINIDILLIGLFLFNILLVTSYCFFNMSIILVVGYWLLRIYSKANRIEFSLICIGFILIWLRLVLSKLNLIILIPIDIKW